MASPADSRPAFQSIAGHARLLSSVAILIGLAMVVSIFVGLGAIDAYAAGDASDGVYCTTNLGSKQCFEVNTVTARDLAEIRGGFAFVATSALLLSSPLFVSFLRRANRNLVELGADGFTYSWRVLVGAVYGPGVNVWRPYQLVRDAWRASAERAVGTGSSNWRSLPVPVSLQLWWFLLAGGFVFRVAYGSFAIGTGESTVFIDSLSTADSNEAIGLEIIALCLNVATLVSAVLAVATFTGIASRQNYATGKPAENHKLDESPFPDRLDQSSAVAADISLSPPVPTDGRATSAEPVPPGSAEGALRAPPSEAHSSNCDRSHTKRQPCNERLA